MMCAFVFVRLLASSSASSGTKLNIMIIQIIEKIKGSRSQKHKKNVCGRYVDEHCHSRIKFKTYVD